MGWFKRLKDGITTATKFKKEAPDGLWSQCKQCKATNTYKELKDNFFKCPKCEAHQRIGSHDYFDLIFDGKFEVLYDDLIPIDKLEFNDLKPYVERLEAAVIKTSLTEAISVAHGKVNRRGLVIAAMDFSFMVI